MDPNTSTRAQFTEQLCSQPVPANASAEWRSYAEKLQSLLRKLADHEAMAPNLGQTYMTPAARKTKVYFMWDFIGRTLGMLYALPPQTKPGRGRTGEAWGDVVGRCVYGASLIKDQPPGMLAMMMQMSGPGASDRNQPVEFGDEIMAEANGLTA